MQYIVGVQQFRIKKGPKIEFRSIGISGDPWNEPTIRTFRFAILISVKILSTFDCDFFLIFEGHTSTYRYPLFVIFALPLRAFFIYR